MIIRVEIMVMIISEWKKGQFLVEECHFGNMMQHDTITNTKMKKTSKFCIYINRKMFICKNCLPIIILTWQRKS